MISHYFYSVKFSNIWHFSHFFNIQDLIKLKVLYLIGLLMIKQI